MSDYTLFRPRLAPDACKRGRNLSADPTATTRFDRFMLGLYCTLLFMLFACAAFVVASGGTMK